MYTCSFFRLYEFDDALNAEEIDLINLKRLCFHGMCFIYVYIYIYIF